jgi:hypothetical protein
MKTLAKYHGYFLATKAAGVWTLDPLADGWTQSVHDPNAFFSETYFDLKGLAINDETIFPQAATVQQNGFTSFGTGAAGESLLVYDIMTSIPVDLTDLDVQNAIVQRGLGFPATVLNFENVIYQRMRRYAFDIDYAGAFPPLADEEQSGSLMPTASDRIYSYRFLLFNVGPTSGGIIPPVRHLLLVNTKEEKEYEYLMRLKRSYDLQQSFDVDGNRPH